MTDRPTLAEITHRLKVVISELSNGRFAATAIDARHHMLDYGYIDSMAAVLLLARVDEMWAVDIDDKCLLDGATTVDELAMLVSRQLAR